MILSSQSSRRCRRPLLSLLKFQSPLFLMPLRFQLKKGATSVLRIRLYELALIK